jgi:hypothetical protein
MFAPDPSGGLVKLSVTAAPRAHTITSASAVSISVARCVILVRH